MKNKKYSLSLYSGVTTPGAGIGGLPPASVSLKIQTQQVPWQKQTLSVLPALSVSSEY